MGKAQNELIRRIDRSQREGTSTGPLAWQDIDALAQGLAFADRPLRRATAKVSERCALGPRGVWMLNLIEAGFVYPHELADIFEIGRSLGTVGIHKSERM